MIVWNNDDIKWERTVVCKINIGNPEKPYIFVNIFDEDNFKSGKEYMTSQARYAEEIEPVTIIEMTMEQVCKELGKNIKIIK